MNLLEEHAREVVGMPPEWKAYEYAAIGRTINQDAKLIRVKGAIAPKKTKGANKGLPNWRKADKTTEREAYFTPAEHGKWRGEWEQKTGKCSECTGKGEVFASWSATDGTKHKPCKKCGGTGQAPNVELRGSPASGRVPLERRVGRRD